MIVDAQYSVPDRVMARQLGGETVILDLSSGTYFGLDNVGARIWALLQQEQALGDIVDVLEQEYDVDRQELESDVARLLDDLVERNLLSKTVG